MIKLSESVRMVEHVNELPRYPGGFEELFLDVETRSGDSKRAGDYPWGGDRIAGIAITVDNDPLSYYVPMRHYGNCNLPIEAVQEWLADILSRAKDWINHNIKFDLAFCQADKARPSKSTRLICTLTMAKMHNTDYGRFGLKTLCREWLGMEMSEELDIKAYLKSIKSKDFGDVPADRLGLYACMDVIGNRALYRFLRENAYDGVPWQTEMEMTALLYEMEEYGFPVDKLEVRKEKLRTLGVFLDNCDKIKALTGIEYSAGGKWTSDVLVNHFHLPILKYHDKTGRPTFDKKALKMYESVTDGDALKAVKLITELRRDSQYLSLFLDPFLALSIDGYIHPRYNQIVRTGRMSCAGPNIQQQNKRSKLLLHPRPGKCFISCDYSQIEFRLIAHYAKDQDVIRAYNEDPDVDFHTLTSALIYNVAPELVTKSQRKKGKMMNFGMGYGMGEAKLIRDLMADPDIIDEVNKHLDEEEVDPSERRQLFEQLCEDRARRVYHTYHERLPGIRLRSEEAKMIAKQRGFVCTAYKRRRHLPSKVARKAFNSVVQGGAMDIIKERMCHLRFHTDVLTRWGTRMVANVHDEVLFEAPEEVMMNKELHDDILGVLEDPAFKFRVPIRAGLGVSRRSWAEAASDDPVRDATGAIVAGKIR